MKLNFINRNHTQSLALFFAGWGMDYMPFKNYKIDCDFAVVYDYNDFALESDQILEYKNIYLFAWSFGVYAANKVICESTRLPIVFKMAINGTQFPIDNERGIPENIFEGTYNALDEKNVLKFYRRMCASTSQYKDFLIHRPCRNFDSLKSELLSVEINYNQCKLKPVIWDKVVISKKDLIFPYENQLNGWLELCHDVIIEDDHAHYPVDIDNIINQNIINKDLVRKRFSKSFSNEYDIQANIQQEIASKLFTKWNEISIPIEGSSVLEIGCGSGMFTKKYIDVIHPSKLVLNDLCNVPSIVLNLNATKYEFIEDDAEHLSFKDNSFDYVVSTSAIQWLENLPRFFDNVFKWLKPGGRLVMSTFGALNMIEIKEITKVSLNYKSENWLNNELCRNFELELINSDICKLFFNSPHDVINHIKETGVNSINSQQLALSSAKRLITDYKSENGLFPLTYNPIYIIARKINRNEK